MKDRKLIAMFNHSATAPDEVMSQTDETLKEISNYKQLDVTEGHRRRAMRICSRAAIASLACCIIAFVGLTGLFTNVGDNENTAPNAETNIGVTKEQFEKQLNEATHKLNGSLDDQAEDALGGTVIDKKTKHQLEMVIQQYRDESNAMSSSDDYTDIQSRFREDVSRTCRNNGYKQDVLGLESKNQ